MQSLKYGEYPFVVSGVNPYPIVVYRKDPLAVAAPRRDMHVRVSGGAELDRVPDQVREHLQELNRIAAQSRQFVVRERHSAFGYAKSEVQLHRCEKPVAVGRHESQRRSADARVFEQ